MAQTYLDLEGLTYFKEKQDLLNASTYATTSYVNTLVGSSVASAYKFKGSKDAVDSLPSTGNTVGDVWNVTATGMNYAWDGSAWDALGTSYSEATASTAGLMSAADKSKLDGVAAGANAYTHPTTAGNKHIPSGGSSGQILRWSAAGTAVWGADNDTTYEAATSSAAGLMSAADKSKLDGVATGANAYSLPAATSSTLGGVKVGSNITNSSGTISLTKSNVVAALGYTPPETDTNTTYSEATTSAAGLMSASDKTKLSGIATGAEVNQNAFSNVTVGSTTIAADGKTDTLTLAGSNVTLTPDATNDKVTIGITKANVTSALGYTPPTQDTTYSDATTSAAGLMTAAMVTKLNGIAEGATKVTVDSSLSSSSTNPVQNKAVNTALAAKAPLASPALTGTPTAPTAASGTSTTQIATTAFVQAATEPIATSVIDALFS